MELWELCDENKNKVGKIIERGPTPDGYFHLIVHVWIKNSRGQYLISRRSASKKLHPLLYECVGGSVIAGETSVQGALRETEEEVGLKFKEEDAKLVHSEVRRIIGEKHFNDIVDVWLINYDGEVDLSNALTDEVESVKWCDLNEIKKLYDDGKLVPTLEYIFWLHKKLQKDKEKKRKILKNKKNNQKSKEKSQYFDFYDDVKHNSHRDIAW